MNISPKVQKSRIGVLMGGVSSERSISIRSGKAVHQALASVGIKAVSLDLKSDMRRVIAKSKIDLAILALHGKGGEDGTVQSILESLNIAYTGSDPKASALMFDKGKAKEVLLKNQIPTPKAFIVNRRGYKTKLKQLIFPFFLKPLEEGSSIGIRLLNDRRTVEEDMALAMKDYDKMLVEEKIFGREITISLLGKEALPIVELFPKNSFYDYEAKYKKGMTRFSLNPNFSSESYDLYQKVALKAFKAFQARDVARVDMIIDSFGNPFVLEVNSLPGMTEVSLLPMAAQKVGLSFPDLCLTLLDFAAKRKKN